jgi:adenylyltransferase/sulfurtransferase
MSLLLSPDTLSELFAHAEAQYPEECCGLVLSDGTVRAARNIQNDLHHAEPQRHPRDARRGYTMSLEDIRILESSFATQSPAVVIYHSHPDVGAYFSDEDRDKALFAGAPVYPVSYVVIDVRQGKAVGALMFSYLDGEFRQTQKFALECSDQQVEIQCRN